MAQSSTAAPDFRSPRQFVDVRGFTRNLIERRSWFIGFILLDIVVIYAIVTDPVLIDAWNYIWPGITVTVLMTIYSFILATIIGLFVALARISKNVLVYNTATFYVELFRGLPLLVIILIFSFVLTPAFVDFVAKVPLLDDLLQRLAGVDPNLIATTTISIRNIPDTTRILFAFALAYGAFMSEVFRAGIESISRGQMEAARSLGMNYIQAMRYIILPQAIRTVLPAMANNFVLLLKDTSLASTVAVPEISYLTRQYSSNRFRYPEGLLCLSFIYANLTIIMSLGVYYLEARLQGDRREG
ncbi:MAG TPA: amino acid ABC transporter permease [Phototrophicaceae bacterium]|nr:amino acid ABC transporter permease [Phototrophicaceae bacterium]